MPAPIPVNQLTTLFAQRPQPWDQLSPLNKLAAIFTTGVPEPLAPDRQTDLPFETAFQQAATRHFTPPAQPTPWRDVVAALGNVAQMGILGRGGFGAPPLSRLTIGNDPAFGPPGSEAAQMIRQIAGVMKRRAAGVPTYQATTEVERDFARLGQPKRVYHGTPFAYQEMDPKMAGKGGGGDLYGPSPGGYWTESPKTAEGYSLHGQQTMRRAMPRSEFEQFKKSHPEADIVGGGPDWVDVQFSPAPNIRVAYLDITKPFDINAVYDASRINKVLVARGEKLLHESADSAIPGRQLTNDQLWHTLQSRYGPEGASNLLREAGYDGITHIGQSGARQWIPFRANQIHEGFQPPK